VGSVLAAWLLLLGAASVRLGWSPVGACREKRGTLRGEMRGKKEVGGYSETTGL
jgi:hypothetical protein